MKRCFYIVTQISAHNNNNIYKGTGDALTCGSYRGIKPVGAYNEISERGIEERVFINFCLC